MPFLLLLCSAKEARIGKAARHLQWIPRRIPSPTLEVPALETALPILLFLGFLFGTTLLILICGIQSRELERSEQSEDPLAGLDLQTLPRFFGRPGEAAVPKPVAVIIDETLVHSVESFLREELALAEVFVEAPSVEGLHSKPATAEPAISWSGRLERHFLREQEVATEFVANPSVESLYGRFEAVPVLV